jgi:hypothetical protein
VLAAPRGTSLAIAIRGGGGEGARDRDWTLRLPVIRLRPRTFARSARLCPLRSASARFQPLSVFGIIVVAFARSCSFLFLQALAKLGVDGIAVSPVFPVIFPVGIAFPALLFPRKLFRCHLCNALRHVRRSDAAYPLL